MREAALAGLRAATGVPSAEAEPRWDLLLVLAAGLILASVARVHLVFPALDVLRPALLFGGLALPVYLLDPHPARRLGAIATPTVFCVFGLLLWAAMGVPLAFRTRTSALFLIDGFMKAALVGLIVAGAVRRARDVERLALVYFAGAALYAAMVLQRFEVGVEDWRLMALYTYDPNDFATFAVTAMPMGVYFLTHRSRALRVVAAAGLLALSAAFVRSGSRGGFLALLVVAAYLVVRYRAVPASRRILGVGLVLAGIMATAAGGFWTRMATLLDIEQDYNLTTETGRVEVWLRGLGYLWDRPVFGLGIANFEAAEGMLSARAELAQYGLGVRWTPPHNSFLQVAAELGVPGLVLFAAAFWTVLAALRRAGLSAAGSERERIAALAPILIASIVGFAVGAFFLSLAYSDMLYALLGLGVGLCKVGREPA